MTARKTAGTPTAKKAAAPAKKTTAPAVKKSTPAPAKKAAEKPVEEAKKKVAVPTVAVTDEDRARLIWVSTRQKRPTQRHIPGCGHFKGVGDMIKDPTYKDATAFLEDGDWAEAKTEREKGLKPCKS